MTDPFASADDAAFYGRALPDSAADGLLANATQMLIDAAGFAILSATATVRLRADCAVIGLRDIPLVTAVTSLELVHEDGTTEAVTAWHWPGTVAGTATDIWLEHSVPERHCGIFAVTIVQGLAGVPDSLKKLTVDVAYRLAAMPAAMSAGITSRTVGGVSWTSAKPLPPDDLTAGECSRLARIIPLRTVWPVKM